MDAAKLVQHQIKRSRPPIDVDPPDPPTIKETSTSPFPNPPSTAKNSRNISDPGRGSLNTLFKDQINNGNLEDEDISLLDKRAWKDFPEIWRSIYEPAKKPLGVDVIEMSREERDAFGALLKRERVRFALMRYRPPNGDIRDLLFKREGVGGECMEEGSLKFDSKGEKCGSKCGSPDRKEGPKGIRRVRRYDKRGMKLEVGSRDASGTDDEKHQLKPRLNSVPKCNVLPSPHDHKYNICKEMDSAKSHNLIASPTKNNKIDNIPSSALSALNAAVTPDSSSLSHVLQSRSIDAASNNHFALLHSDPDKHDKLLDLFFHSILQLVPGQIPHVFKVVCSEVYSISGVYVLSLGTVTEEAGGKRYPRYKREDKAERKSDSDFSTSYWLDMDIWSKDGGWIIWMERTHKVNGLQYESTILAYDTSLTRSLHPGLAVLKQWAARTDVEETYQSIKCGAIIAMRAVCGTLSMKPTKNEDLYCGRTVRGVITCEGKPKYLEDEGQSCQIVRDGISKTSPKETRVEMRAACIVTAFFQEQNRRCCEMHKQPGFVSSDKRACCFSYLGFKSEQEYRAYRAHQFHFCSGEYPGCLMLLDQDTRIKIMEFYKSFLRRGLREGNGERHVDDLLKWGAAEVRIHFGKHLCLLVIYFLPFVFI